MTHHEVTYTMSETVVETKPRTREEVRDELQEETRVVEMKGLSPEEKRLLERRAIEGSAGGEVELAERAYHRRRPETRAEIERLVDLLGSSRAPEPATEPVRAPAPRATAAPAPAPAPVGRVLSPAEKSAIAAHLGGDLVWADTRFATTRGRVVDVHYRHEGLTREALVLLDKDGRVTTEDEMAHRLDALPLPDQPARAAYPPSLSRASPEPRAVPPPLVVAHRGSRWRLPPAEARAPIEAVEGIAEVYGKKLRAQGVNTLQDLLDSDTQSLAAATDLSHELLAKWQSQVQLQVVNGIGPQYSELLVRAGIRSMEELARQEPGPLAKRLNDYEASLGKRVQGTLIDPTRTENWVAQARELTGVKPSARAAALLADEAEAGDAEEAEAKPSAKAAKKGKLGGLKFGKGKAAKAPKKAAEPSGTADEEPAEQGGKKRFGLGFGRKK